MLHVVFLQLRPDIKQANWSIIYANLVISSLTGEIFSLTGARFTLTGVLIFTTFSLNNTANDTIIIRGHYMAAS